jgi:hypothetical protein
VPGAAAVCAGHSDRTGCAGPRADEAKGPLEAEVVLREAKQAVGPAQGSATGTRDCERERYEGNAHEAAAEDVCGAPEPPVAPRSRDAPSSVSPQTISQASPAP